MVTGGAIDDARTQSSSIPAPGTYTIGEFADDAGEIGANADAEWAQVVACLQDVYSPYAVTITDQLGQIPAGASYTEAIVAGLPGDVGIPEVFGIAPEATTCSALDDAIAFAFANAAPSRGRVDYVCALAAQQMGRIFGLDPLFEGMPSCDVMSARTDCGGELFFRNETATCTGCRCGPTQNSDEDLVSLFGAGVSSVPVTSAPGARAPWLGRMLACMRTPVAARVVKVELADGSLGSRAAVRRSL